MSEPEDPSSPRSLVLHVLCPSIPAPNRFTFDNLSLNTTVADLKARLSRSIQSQPSADSQRLFYLGKPLLDDAVTLQSLFGPLNGSEFSMHLVLPPSQAQFTNISNQDTLPSFQTSTSTSRANPPQYSAQPTEQAGSRARYRSSDHLSQADLARALQENARRRLMELSQHNGAISQHRSWDSVWTSPRPFHQSQLHIPEPSAAGIRTTAPFVATPTSPHSASAGEIQLPSDVQSRLRLLKQYISLAEEQLNCGISPSIDHVIQLRTHLFKLLDDQLQRPLSERGERLEPLISRVFEISSRADYLRQRHLLTVHPSSSRAEAPMYLLSSPNGYKAVVAAAAASSSSNAAAVLRPMSWTSGTTPPATAPVPNTQPNAEAAVMENVVRQAVLNQRPAAEGQLSLGRNLRRLWLFVRLYFFCFMFSPAGSWTRIIYVALAVVASMLSETSVPRRMYDLILAPVQRHLEGLVHFLPEEEFPPAPQNTEGTGDEAATSQQAGVRNGREANWTAGLHHSIRRVERSAALFIASLVPGVGERHIEVRNAAEAAHNAELARQEEERRRQEEQAAAATTEEQATTDEEPQADDSAASDLSNRATAGSATPPERQPLIPQEA
ncbi:hypothetical protein BJY01DRAFT_90024 [Aspergillus pseudoustus]|uniref:Ubiquitin-like domain-containing protein n=1 Tax=Aspergillus pseudoustus TaxID=1810923 RepID=A0ABR4J1Q3_9EURO